MLRDAARAAGLTEEARVKFEASQRTREILKGTLRVARRADGLHPCTRIEELHAQFSQVSGDRRNRGEREKAQRSYGTS